MNPATFRAAFAALEPQEVLTVLSWILEPGQGDPSPDMPDAWLDATLPLTKAFQVAYREMEYSLDEQMQAADRAADEADRRYDEYRDRQMMDRIEGLAA